MLLKSDKRIFQKENTRSMLILNSPEVTQETCLRWKRESPIAFVPTMGCLHDGHLALVQRAKELAPKVVVSIFVNPLQFGPNEDFEKYPRVFEEDCRKLESMGVDLLFHPSVKDLYPDGFSTKISVGEIANRLCGAFRPGHFDGVATVVLKLFEITSCDYAVFGEKDFQQLTVIQQITRDFNLPVCVIPFPTVRADDQVALSSRNSYLSSSEREAAQKIPQALSAARKEALSNPHQTVGELLNKITPELSREGLKIQYLEITQSRRLLPTRPEERLESLSQPHLFVAVYAGSTRLIDNVSLNSGQ
ncbi:MAG: pantoate--beta-alanine ligase [Proteobacteria bacterium]|nr:pantoate--beta-alanine ligase [Pseudomonadota bacterium]